MTKIAESCGGDSSVLEAVKKLASSVLNALASEEASLGHLSELKPQDWGE